MSRLFLFLLLTISIVITTPLVRAQTAVSPVMIKLEATASLYQPNDLISLPLKINTQGESIYSLQTDISFPADGLEVVKIDTSNSVFPLQVIQSFSPGKISLIRGSFSAVNTTDGLIGIIWLKALKSGSFELVFDPSTVALNAASSNQTTALGTTIKVASLAPSPSPSPSMLPTPSPSAPPSPAPSPLPSVSVSPTPLPSVSPTPTKSTITIFAAGTPAEGVYPTLALQIRNAKRNSWKTVKTFTNVSSLLNQLTYTHTTTIQPQDIRVRFTNDRYLPKKGEDRNLYIDKINLDGVDIETERKTTFSTGSWTFDNGCGQGFKSSEWLHCNGYFEYR